MVTWKIPSKPIEEFEKSTPNIHPVLRQYLWNRGITNPDHIKALLSREVLHDQNPLLMKDMAKGVARIWKAIVSGEVVCVFGDYDADGVTATATMVEGISMMADYFGLPLKVASNEDDSARDATLYYKVPKRSEGYGLHEDAIVALAEKYDGKRGFPKLGVLLTVDNGIKSKIAAETAKSFGIDLVVTDHHSVDANSFPEAAYAVINPQQDDCPYYETEIAGCFVAFKFIQALALHALDGKPAEELMARLERLKEFVAIGTICDMMPMDSLENRRIVYEGLSILKSNPSLGIYALCNSREHGAYPIIIPKIDSTTIGFSIGPPINASGRMEDPNHALELLMAKDADRAEQLATKILRLNTDRKSVQKDMADRLSHMMEAKPNDTRSMPIIIEKLTNANVGIVGLLASDMAYKYSRPAIIFTNSGHVDKVRGELLKASARSVVGMHITNALGECADMLVSFGGHSMAAGLSLYEDVYDKFVEKMSRLTRMELSLDKDEQFVQADVEIPLSAIDWQLYHISKHLEPYGSAFPNIRFMTRGLHVSEAEVWSASRKHLKMFVSDDKGNRFQANGWNMASWANNMPPKVDLIYQLEEASWGKTGPTYLRLAIESIQASSNARQEQPLIPISDFSKIREALGPGKIRRYI